jgi:hypothetical protein
MLFSYKIQLSNFKLRIRVRALDSCVAETSKNTSMNQMKKGDYVFGQYGHNDMRSKAAHAPQSSSDNLGQIVEITA